MEAIAISVPAGDQLDSIRAKLRASITQMSAKLVSANVAGSTSGSDLVEEVLRHNSEKLTPDVLVQADAPALIPPVVVQCTSPSDAYSKDIVHGREEEDRRPQLSRQELESLPLAFRRKVLARQGWQAFEAAESSLVLTMGGQGTSQLPPNFIASNPTVSVPPSPQGTPSIPRMMSSPAGSCEQMPPPPDMSPQDMALFNAAQEAQHTQFMRQAQFLQATTSQSSPSIKQLSRFKDDFRPLQICRLLMSSTDGVCKRGIECTFAHSYDELHPSVLEAMAADEGKSSNSALAEDCAQQAQEKGAMRLRTKRDICRRFKQKECLLGAACMSAHDEKEIGEVHLVYVVPVKGAICKFWKAGRCAFGSLCYDAHGEHELGCVKPHKTPGVGMIKRMREPSPVHERESRP